MGSGREATPGQCDTPGWPTRSDPGVEPGPRGYEKIALPRNVRRMTQHSVIHTIGWKANGDVSVLLLRSDPDDPDPSEIARVCKYVLCYGCKGVEQPKIQRQLWADAVLGSDERCEAKAICTKLLNATVARRMITKAECMVEAGDLPLWGCSEVFTRVSLSGFRRLQTAGDTGTRDTLLDKYRRRPVAIDQVSLYNYVCSLGGVPVFTGAALRPQWPPSDGFARAMLLLHKPWRHASDLRPADSDSWIPEFERFFGSESCPMALKVNVERARASNRARRANWEDPSQAEVVDPEDIEEDDPRIYARLDDGAGDIAAELSGFSDYGDCHDWSSVPPRLIEAGFPKVAEASAWLAKRVGQVKSTGQCDDLVEATSSGRAMVNPHDANSEQRFAIALVLQTLRNWVEGAADYRPLRLLTAGVAGTGKSFVIHALCAMVRNLLGADGAARVFAPTGVAAFQVGGETGHRLFRLPTGKKAFGQLEPLKGDALRAVQDNLRQCALLIGDERGMIGRTMLGWQEYNASLAPFANADQSSGLCSWGGRPVVNLLGDDLQLPPVLDAPCYDRTRRGPAANHGLLAHDGFRDAAS